MKTLVHARNPENDRETLCGDAIWSMRGQYSFRETDVDCPICRGIASGSKTCDGCGSPVLDWRQRVRLDLFPGLEVDLCASRTGSSKPKTACLRKARERRSRCPGCGVERAEVGTVCARCVERIESAKRVERDDGPLVRSTIPKSLPHLRDHSLRRGERVDGDDFERDLRERFLIAFARAMGGRGASFEAWGSGVPVVAKGGPYSDDRMGIVVELTAAQREAARSAYTMLEQLLEDFREDGRREGRNLLLGLASGETTIAAYNEATANGGGTK